MKIVIGNHLWDDPVSVVNADGVVVGVICDRCNGMENGSFQSSQLLVEWNRDVLNSNHAMVSILGRCWECGHKQVVAGAFQESGPQEELDVELSTLFEQMVVYEKDGDELGKNETLEEIIKLVVVGVAIPSNMREWLASHLSRRMEGTDKEKFSEEIALREFKMRIKKKEERIK